MSKKTAAGCFYTLAESPDLLTMDEVMDFDSRLCRSGVKKFVRKVSHAERMQCPVELKSEMTRYGYVLVEEIVPGVRSKSYLEKIVTFGDG